MKKFIAMITAACIIGGAAPTFESWAPDAVITADAADTVASGTCGESVNWSLDDAGTLTISGEGGMYNWKFSTFTSKDGVIDVVNFEGDPMPWFEQRSSIKRIVIEDGVTSVGDLAFLGLGEVTDISLPDSLLTIGEYSFTGCVGITSIDIPDSVTRIRSDAFEYCTGLSDVRLSESITTLTASLFEGCTSLETITVPVAVSKISYSAFKGCSSLKTIVIPEDNASFTSRDGVLFNKDMTALLRCPEGWNGTEYTVPDTVTSIGEAAFYSCVVLEEVTLPSSVKSISIDAFNEYGFNGSEASLKALTILAPSCDIYDVGNTITDNVCIYGYIGSTAQEYAENYERTFVSIGELGDVNGDTYVDSSDAALILRHYAAYQADGVGTFNDVQLAVADYNSDGSVDSSDAALILKYYAENQAK